ncbi:MAG: sialidase family protein [Sphingomonas sp.]
MPPRGSSRHVDNQIVYRREDEFASWPHTMGFWDMGDGELLQNFLSNKTNYSDAQAISHDNVIRIGASKMVTVRSRDYGRTWSKPVDNLYDTIAKGTENARSMGDLGPIDYRDRNVLVANSGTDFGAPEGRAFVRVSRDRGHHWSPGIPGAARRALFARGDQLGAGPPGRHGADLADGSRQGRLDRHPLIHALPPGGTDFHFMSFITPKTDPYGAADGDYTGTFRFGGHRWFYPRGLLLPSGRMLCTLRCQRDPRGIMWTELYASDDGGRTWEFLSRVNDFGSPGSLVRLKDGRLVMVYGYRLMPSGIRAAVSTDEGRTWGPELIVRDDGGSWTWAIPTPGRPTTARSA